MNKKKQTNALEQETETEIRKKFTSFHTIFFLNRIRLSSSKKLSFIEHHCLLQILCCFYKECNTEFFFYTNTPKCVNCSMLQPSKVIVLFYLRSKSVYIVFHSDRDSCVCVCVLSLCVMHMCELLWSFYISTFGLCF